MEHSELQLSAVWFIAHKLEKSTAYRKSGEGFNQNIIIDKNVNDTCITFQGPPLLFVS